MDLGLLKRIYWRILRGLGFKQAAWDKQFKEGKWCDEPHSHYTVRLAIQLCDGGKLVEFGCGEGILPRMLPSGAFSQYVGIDISKVAIERAESKARKAGVQHCLFAQGDMAGWEGTDSVSLILLEECLYYLTPSEMEQFLTRCCESLTPQGHLLVIVHSARKHKKALALCRQICSVEKEEILGGRTFLTLGPGRSSSAVPAGSL